MNLDDAVQLFIQDRETSSCGIYAIKAYQQHLMLLSKFLRSRNTTCIEEVSPQQLISYLADLRSHNLSPATVRQRATHIRTFFRWVHTVKLIDTDPSDSILIPRRPKQLPKTLKPEEIKTLAATELPTRDKALLFLILDSGLRRSEVAQLELDDVDLQRGMAHVRHGKGNKERWVIFADKARDALTAWLHERHALCGVSALFTTKDGEAIKPGGIYKAVRRAALKAGVPARPHRLRHTFATNYLDRGGNIHDLQALMGHESITTTMIYVSVSLQKIREHYKQLSLLDNL